MAMETESGVSPLKKWSREVLDLQETLLILLGMCQPSGTGVSRI